MSLLFFGAAVHDTAGQNKTLLEIALSCVPGGPWVVAGLVFVLVLGLVFRLFRGAAYGVVDHVRQIFAVGGRR